MDSGLYAAYTGLMARSQALDTAANNLANAGTDGFRAERDYFRGVLEDGSVANPAVASQVGGSVNGFGVLGGNRLDLSQGDIAKTGNPTDVALRGDGFFVIQAAGGKTLYTRDGSFSLSPSGVLQTAHGEPVLDVKGKSITVPTGMMRISGDGSVSVATADGNSAVVGQIGVFKFGDKAALHAESGGRLSADASAKPVTSDALMEQGAIEGSNEDAVHGTMQLVLVQRQAEMMQKALSVFNNDFDKTAAEELPRV
jgi:flagellar basal-body rod protein FlgF/flagellar basal-body rod protein FlgG